MKKLMDDRIAKLNSLKEAGIEPYPHTFVKKHDAAELQKKYKKLKKEEHTKDKVQVAGRIRSLRIMGKAAFLDIENETAKIQLYFQQDKLKDYKLLKKLDTGDFLGASGLIFKTKTGEITVEVKKFTILAKSTRPLPSDWYGLKNPETKYRNRHLDMLMNPDVRERFRMRSLAITYMREYLDKLGFLEVETPILQPVYGGANAKPFITHLNAMDMKVYLSIAPELYLKRLIMGGYERVYTICKNFRNEGIDRSHNPEFTMMECYAAYWDYNDQMKLVEDCYEYIFKKVLGTTKVKFEDATIDFKTPWKRITMYDSVKQHTGINVKKLNAKEIVKAAKEKGIKLESKGTKGELVIELFDEYASPRIVQPTFVIDHPKESTPLCKVHRKDPELIERFEPFVYGYEIGNAYTELNDPIKQRKLFEESKKKLDSGDEEAHPLDEEFLDALENGMPNTGGLGLGIDRMIMFLTSQHSIRDVIIFPFMRKEGGTSFKDFGKLKVSDNVLEKFPGLTIGMLEVENINNKGSSKEIQKLIRKEETRIRKNIKELGEQPKIKSWRVAFKQFGADPKKQSSSVEALHRIILKGNNLREISKLVDIYNYISIKYMVPAGGDDLDKVDGFVKLHLAKGDEHFQELNSDEVRNPKAGEVVYSDDKEILCRRWNWRESEKTKMTESTKNAVLVIEGIPPVTEKDVKKALDELESLIKKYCGGTSKQHIIK